jgi:transglutaminase-like putative cysteine protease
MRALRCFVLLASMFAAVSAHGQHSEDWLPITAQDLAFKDVPGDRGAAAVQLYYADFRDDNQRYQFIYRRIKVLTESGRKFANVEIPIQQQYSITDIQARSIHPDGSVVNFTGKPFEKVIAKKHEDKFLAKVFTIPDVSVGSIVEYKYRLIWEQYFYDAVWTVQHDLYTVSESFWLRPYRGPIHTRYAGDETQLSYVYSNMPSGVAPKDTGAGVELTMTNVPAFKAEQYMPPEDNFRAEVRFFYGGREIESPEIFWRDVGKEWYAKAEKFIGSHDQIKEAAAEIAAGETDPQQKLKKLYERVQQIRNLDFERERTRAEEKKENLKANDSVADVLARGYGTRNEIAELFVALARAAGFEAELLRASNRKTRVFDSKLLSADQLPDEIVQVKLKDSFLYLDPGTRFCPFGMVRWNYTSAPALKLDKSGGSFTLVPTATADKTIIRRTAKVRLNALGSARGEITVEFKGNEALQHRLDALKTDDAGRRGDLEDELVSWLPKGSQIDLIDVQGWESDHDPLIARFNFELPQFAVTAGKRLMTAADLFRSPQEEVFSASARQYPVYFPYTYEELDNIAIEVPVGYSVETVPSGQDVKTSSTRFITTRSMKGNSAVMIRALVVNSIYFQPEQYPVLKSFFDKLRTADEEQIVIGGGARASN